MVYLAWLFYIQWWHTSLLLFDRSKLDPTTKGLNNQMEDQISLSDGLSSQTYSRRFVINLLQNLSTVFTFISKGGNRLNGGSNEFIWWLIKLNSLKKVRDASLENIFSVSIFTSRCGDWSTPMVNWMSLSDGLWSRTHWRRFVIHLCKTFLVFSHSYQSVVTKWGSERIPRGMLISRQISRIVYIHFFNPQWDSKSHPRSGNPEDTSHYLQ